MRRRKGLYTMDDHPVEVFRKGKKKLFVDTVTGQALMHNPKPRKAGIGTKLKRALGKADQATPFLGGAAHELLPGLIDAEAGAVAPTAPRRSVFDKALALEQLEKQRMCESYHSGRKCSCGAR